MYDVPVFKTILLADDSEDDVAWVLRILAQAGVVTPVQVVPDGDQVVAYLSGMGPYANRGLFPLPGVLLLDLKMPRRDGIQVLEWCQSQPQLKEMLVVILSGHHELLQVKHAYSLGANSFLLKPITAADLANLMKSFTGYWVCTPPLGSENSATVPQ